MAYSKPQVIAQNASTGSYAAGCPTNTRKAPQGSSVNYYVCKECELTQ